MTDTQKPVHNRRRQRWLIGAALLLLLPLAAGMGLKAMFPPERLREIAEPQLERRLSRDVRIESVRLKLVPYVAIRLGGVEVANPPGFSDAPSVQFDALDLRLRLFPLLRRRYELSQVRLIRPLLRYEVAADGTNNLTGLLASDSTSDEAARPSAGSFQIRDLIVADGDVLVRDQRARRALRFGVDASFEARSEGGGSTLAADGSVDLTEGLMISGGSDSTWLPDIVTTFQALIDTDGSRVAVPAIEVAAAELRLSGEATSRVEPDGRRVRVVLSSGEFDVATLIDALRHDDAGPDTIRVGGRGQLELTWAGRLGDPGPELSGTMALAGLTVETPGRGRIVDALTGRFEFTNAAAVARDLRGRLLGRPATARMRIEDFSNPVVSGHVAGSVDVERINDFRSEAPLAVDGLASFEIDFRGPARSLPDWTLTGPVRLSDVTWASPSLPEPAGIGDATVQLTGSGITAESIPVRLGTSEIRLSLSSASYVKHALAGDPDADPPLIEFSARSSRLAAADLRKGTEQIGYADLVKARLAGRRVDGRSAESIAAGRYRRPEISGLRAVGTASIDEWVNPPMNASAVTFELSIADGVIEVTGLTGNVYGGRLEGGLTFDTGATEPPYHLDYDLRLEGANADAVLERWTRLGRALTGSVNLAARGRAPLDATLLPVATGFEAAGRSEFVEGRFQDFGISEVLTRYMAVASDRVRGFKDLGGPFTIRDGKFFVENWGFEYRGLAGAVGGTAGLGGLLDLEVALLVEPEDLAAMGFVRSDPTLSGLVAQLQDGGTIPLRIAMGGTMADPQPRVDLPRLTQAVRDRLQAGARDRLEREGRGALEEAGRGLLDRLRGQPADTSRADSATSPTPGADSAASVP